MASDRPSLQVEEREERGSRAARRLRRSGQVPGVLYGGSHAEGVPFKAAELDLKHLLAGDTALLDIKIGSEKTVPVIIKDQQLHPVRDEVMHIDFLEVDLTEKIHAETTIELIGAEDSPGVKDGGVLDQPNRDIGIEALPTDIPERIEVDVSALEIGGTLTLAEVTPPSGVTFLDENPEEVTLASIVLPTKVEEPEVETETELVGEDGEPVEAEGDADGDSGEESGGDGGGDSGDSE